MIKIPEFTLPELNEIRKLANFTEREEILFDLRSKDISHEQCAEIMNLSTSTEYRINRRMLNKIIRIIGRND